MQSTKKLFVMALVSLCWVPTVAAAQSAVDKPAMKVGDTWEFQQSVKTTPGGETSEPWSRRVAEILPNGQVQLAGGKGQLILTDGSLNQIDPKGAEYSLTVFKFPMSVGVTWDYSARVADGMAERRGHYKVAAWEPVTVPAGTFECFRVEGDWQATGRFFNTKGRDTYWYCPKLNFFAKRQSEFTRQPRDQPPVTEERLSEMIKFTAAP